MLDLAAHATRHSRLACQILLTDEMETLSVRVPPTARNWLGLRRTTSRNPRIACAAWWEPERPGTKSLWLLPSGPDQVGDSPVRPAPARHMVAFLSPRQPLALNRAAA